MALNWALTIGTFGAIVALACAVEKGRDGMVKFFLFVVILFLCAMYWRVKTEYNEKQGSVMGAIPTEIHTQAANHVRGLNLC